MVPSQWPAVQAHGGSSVCVMLSEVIAGSVDHIENVYEKRVRKKQPKMACPSGPPRQSLCLCIDRNEKWS